MTQPLSGPLHVLEFGSGDTELIWAHGWGHNHKAFLSVAEGLGDGYRHVLVDFPGFGASPMPSEPWGTLDYAECLTAFLQSRPRTRRVWIGHSFGCRVGIRIAARHPGLLDGLVLVAAAGIPRPVSLLEKIRRAIRKKMFALGKMLARSEADREKLRNKFGSPDYRNAGALRPTFVKVVNENLSDDARAITLPVKLIYGETDSETPPVLGANFQKLMGKATLSVLPRFGHIDILSSGRFQLQKEIKDFLRSLS